MEIEFTGKKVLVTGASRGIGKQISDDFEKLGAEVMRIDSSVVDLSNRDAVNLFIKEIDETDRIDILVNNAGINFSKHLKDFDQENHDKLMEVNLNSAFKILGAVSKLMIKNKYGKIVNISSIMGTRARDGKSSYAAAKAGLIGMTKAAAAELGPYGILVNSISPGFTKTEMTSRMLPEEEATSLTNQIPMKRMATPKDISNVVLFMCSDHNTFVTGQDIIVDGGFTYSITP